jgi:hypothetical protein
MAILAVRLPTCAASRRCPAGSAVLQWGASRRGISILKGPGRSAGHLARWPWCGNRALARICEQDPNVCYTCVTKN